MTQRSFPARWLAVLLMGSVGAAWALNPTAQEGGLTPSLPLAARTVIEGNPQVVSQLMGSLIGEVALSVDDRNLLTSGAASRRVVLESQVAPASRLQMEREKAAFSRAVEDLEAEYVARGGYPALPATAGEGAPMSYRTDGEEFTLSSGHRRYSVAQGMTFGAPPTGGTAFGVKGFLETKASGWGPWRGERVALEPKAGIDGTEALGFLEDLPLASPGSARMFFPVDRGTCGYLFSQANGKSAYSSGELTYEGVSGNFALKLFRPSAVNTHSLNPSALETELAHHDAATALVGEARLLADLGLMSLPKEGEEVVALSSSAPLRCSVGTALDGLRLATLERHKQVLTAGKFMAAEGTTAKATLVGSVQVVDKLGQLHNLRIRAGRGMNYDWIVGQVCPISESPRPAGFVDSAAASYDEPTPEGWQTVKAGQ